jgi:hypothetical protein
MSLLPDVSSPPRLEQLCRLDKGMRKAKAVIVLLVWYSRGDHANKARRQSHNGAVWMWL